MRTVGPGGPVWRVLGIALWFGLLTGVGECAYLLYTKEITHYRVFGYEFLWQVPVGYATLFGVIGIVVLGVGRLLNKANLFVVAVGCSAFVLAMAWLTFLLKSVHPYASAVLGVGMALQVARWVGRHPGTLQRIAVRTGPVLGAVVALVAVAAFLWPGWEERGALARLPPPPASAPNVLLVVLDTVGAKHVGSYGYARDTTPFLDRFAAKGVVFDHAFATAPWTLPSHGSMFTGRPHHEIGGGWVSALVGNHTTVAEVFSANGYETAGFIGNLTYCLAAFGLGRGFVHYDDRLNSISAALLRTSLGTVFNQQVKLVDHFGTDDNLGRRSADVVNREFLRWLSGRTGSRPYFAFLNYFDAHDPYLPPADFATKFYPRRPLGLVEAKPLDQWGSESVREFEAAYDGAIRYLDAKVAELFADLERRGSLDNTIVIITADHGEQFGEHGLLRHGNSLYAQLLHVPLIIVYPRAVPAARRVSEFVTLRDLPSTLIDLAALRMQKVLPGASLVTAWAPENQAAPGRHPLPLLSEVEKAMSEAFPKWYPGRQGRMKSVIVNGYHYIKNYGSGREELYRLSEDPEELVDLSQTEPALLRDYRVYLQTALETGSTTPSARGRAK